MIAENAILLPVILPLVAATLAFLFKGRIPVAVGLAAAATIPPAAGYLALRVLREGPQRYALGGWDAPLGIELYADGLSAFMLLMTALVGSAASVYAAGFFRSYAGSERRFFWPLSLFFWTSLNVLFLSGDVFNLYVALELLGLSAAGLVTLEGKRAAVVAGMRYLLVSLVGSLAYLAGVALLYGAYGTLSIRGLGEVMSPEPATWTAISLITLGMALKTALFPLHFWLPPAYASASAPAAALLSGLATKASFYLLLRLWFDAFPTALTPAAGQLLGLLGAVGIVWGSVLALRQRRLGMLVAYSSIGQIGYLFLLFPLATTAEWGFDAWSGAVYLALAHACAKAAMFMALGTIVDATGHDEIAGMDGLAQHLPIPVATFALSGVTLMGLPTSGGFTAKWLLLNASVESGQWWLAAVVLAGGLLAAGYVFRFLNHALLNLPTEKIHHRAPRATVVSAFALALVSLSLGLLSAPLLELLRVGAPFPVDLIPGAGG